METDRIRLNQLGFYPNERKIAVVTDPVNAKEFSIKNALTDELVYTAMVSEPRLSDFSPRKTSILDFSLLTEPGRYIIEVTSVGKSYPFEIKENVLHDLAIASLKGFYYQRSSISIEERYAGKWHRPFGHKDDSVMVHPSAATQKRPFGTVISSSGGWYDAGDYNKYIVNSGFATGVLLSFYEDYEDYAKKTITNIPESENTTPDLLDEVAWNLKWMLTMQDTDGGVYHKLTTPKFEDFIMPEECMQQRYVVAKSVTASLDFAASMAQASRIFMDYRDDYPGLDEKMLEASRRAFEWALKNLKLFYDQNALNEKFEPHILTGEYGDNDANDELFWAAAELFITTGKSTYLRYLYIYSPKEYIAPTWTNVSSLGLFSLIRYVDMIEDAALIEKIKKMIIDYANNLIDNYEMTSFSAPYGNKVGDFYWGSNSDAASNRGITLLFAWQMTGERRYLEAALQIADYILGRNATGYCYVLGYGVKTPRFPHHRLSASDGIEDPIPGLLIGGPNIYKEDGCEYFSDIADECYVDNQDSYASNEVAINWQAMFFSFIGALDSALQDTSKSN